MTMGRWKPAWPQLEPLEDGAHAPGAELVEDAVLGLGARHESPDLQRRGRQNGRGRARGVKASPAAPSVSSEPQGACRAAILHDETCGSWASTWETCGSVSPSRTRRGPWPPACRPACGWGPARTSRPSRPSCAIARQASSSWGYPKNLAGEIGPQAEKVLAFVADLRAALAVPIVTWDERFTTALAEPHHDRRWPLSSRSARVGGPGLGGPHPPELSRCPPDESPARTNRLRLFGLLTLLALVLVAAVGWRLWERRWLAPSLLLAPSRSVSPLPPAAPSTTMARPTRGGWRGAGTTSSSRHSFGGDASTDD